MTAFQQLISSSRVNFLVGGSLLGEKRTRLEKLEIE